MKKRIKKIILILIIFLGINVYAEDAWPKTFEYEDYKYSIEGIRLDIYQLDKNSKELVFEESGENYSSTVRMTEDEQKYINGETVRSITLSPSEYTIDPTYKEGVLNDIDTTFIHLGLNLTKDKLETMLSNELSSATDTKSYMIDIIVSYKLINYPSKYTTGYNMDVYRLFQKLGLSAQLDEIDFEQTNEQILSRAMVGYDEDQNKNILAYDNEINQKNILMLFNYTCLSKNEITAVNDEDNEEHIIMFHLVNNIDILEDGFDEDDDILTNPITSVPTVDNGNQVVKVEDTAAFSTKSIYIIGLLAIILGTTMISRQITKRNIRE